jgi:hypothetical protein
MKKYHANKKIFLDVTPFLAIYGLRRRCSNGVGSSVVDKLPMVRGRPAHAVGFRPTYVFGKLDIELSRGLKGWK